MPAFPMFVDLSQKSVLIVGGGQIALHKAKALEPFGPRLFVVAPDVDTAFDEMPSVTVRRKEYSEDDLKGMDMVVAATDDYCLNAQVAADAGKHQLPVNVVDEPDLCGFYFGSMITEGDLTVAVSTDGASPAAARETEKEDPGGTAQGCGSISGGDEGPAALGKAGVSGSETAKSGAQWAHEAGDGGGCGV